MLMLHRLRQVISRNGIFILGSVTLADTEFEEYMRFVADSYRGDPSWWWVPGRAAFCGMLRATGFEVEAEFGVSNGPSEHFRVMNRSVRARAA